MANGKNAGRLYPERTPSSLDEDVEKLSYEEKLERAKNLKPLVIPYSVNIWICRCGRISLSEIEARHMIGFPNEFGLPNCPYDEGSKLYNYIVRQEDYLRSMGESVE